MGLTGKTVFVTGATGFLGGALARRLAAEGAQVRALARRPEKATYIRDVDNIEIVQGDITDAERLRAVIPSSECVFHVAAALAGPIDQQRRLNADGTRNVAQAAAEAGVQRFVHVSSIAVYGYDQHVDVTEATPPNPGSDPYNITKLEAENELHRVAAERHLMYSIIRPGMIYGPRSGMWTKQLFRLARLRPTPFLGSGNGLTFVIYVDDVVDLMLVLAEHPAAANEAFNCVSDPAPTWREFLSIHSALAGHQSWLPIPPGLIYPLISLIGLLAKPQTQAKALLQMTHLIERRIAYPMTKAREQLGWSPKVDLQTGARNCIPYLREQGLLK